MTLSLDDVRKVARLARLSLSPAEEAQVQKQLSAILESVALLKQLDTTHVLPTSHALFGETPLREDEVQPSLPADKALGNAPARSGTSFAVPKILE